MYCSPTVHSLTVSVNYRLPLCIWNRAVIMTPVMAPNLLEFEKHLDNTLCTVK